MFNDEDAFEYENINDTVLATHAVPIIINLTPIMNIIVILIMIIFITTELCARFVLFKCAINDSLIVIIIKIIQQHNIIFGSLQDNLLLGFPHLLSNNF